MVTPDEEYDQYVKDPRTKCKFGSVCYQKNPLHHQDYKHPPKKRQAEDKPSTPSKRKKIDNHTSSASSKAPQTNGTEPSTSVNGTKQEPENKIRTHVSIEDAKAFIKEKFLVEMPKDFYSFWEFCKILSKDNPCNAFASADLYLVGPYDVLVGKFNNVDKTADEYLIHWRYYRDPPEFQTVLKGSRSEYHIGYFRDEPNALPVLLASNDCLKNGEFSCMGDNIFAAVWVYLEHFKKKCDPFKKLNVNKLQNSLKEHAGHLQFNLDAKAESVKERDKKIVVRSFNTLGLVVPYNRKTQLGYRHLCIGNAELKKLLDRVVKASPQQRNKVMSDVQPVLTATSIATDECDFGTGIELGWNMLAHGVDSLNSTIARFLSTNYELIDRAAFANIIRAHMQNRKKGVDLSIV